MKTIKANFDKTLVDPKDKVIIEDVLKRVNRIIFTCSHFIRAYILYLYEEKKEIPDISKEFIRTAFSVITIKTVGPKKKKCLELMESMEQFWKNKFSNKVRIKKMDCSNLSFIIQEAITEMHTSYTNNIKMNFFRYLRQYVNKYFQDEFDKVEEADILSELKKELSMVKSDIIDGTLVSPRKYHQFIKKTRKSIIPTGIKNIPYTLKSNPYVFLKGMLIMNDYLDKNGRKLFQPVSLRTDTKTKYITIDTRTLFDIFPTEVFKIRTGGFITNKADVINNLPAYQDLLWACIFKTDRKMFKLKRHEFNYRVSTDGYAISINFMDRRELIDSTTKKNRMKAGMKNKDKKTAKKAKPLKKNKTKKVSDPSDQSEEFQYIGHIVNNETKMKTLKEKYNEGKIVVVDPGKRDIGMFMGSKGDYYKYSSRRRIKETKRKKYGDLIDHKKNNIQINDGSTIKEYETKLNKYKRKGMNLEQFLVYTSMKLKLQEQVQNLIHYDVYLRKLNWFSYINKERHESKIMNELKNKYGKDVTVVVGDWNGHNNKLKYISTPGIGFKRRLAKEFDVYLIDEYKTSKIINKTKKEADNLTLKINGKERKLHAVLTYQMGNKRIGCINRDKNATLNMMEIVYSLIKNKTRPSVFERPKLLEPANPHESKKVKTKKIIGKTKVKSSSKKLLSECLYGV